MEKLSGKTALVTGSTGGVGRLVASPQKRAIEALRITVDLTRHQQHCETTIIYLSLKLPSAAPAANLQRDLSLQVAANRTYGDPPSMGQYPVRGNTTRLRRFHIHQSHRLFDGEIAPARHPLDADGDDREAGELHPLILPIA